jgi:hypothetical protein
VTHPLFQLGRLLITPGAMELLDSQSLADALARYRKGDWGNLCASDKRSNDEAVKEGLRILASYDDASAHRFWIITEWDRSYTTILLPEEY